MWVSTAPFGRPVVPEVYMMRAGESSGTSTVGTASCPSSSTAENREGAADSASPTPMSSTSWSTLPTACSPVSAPRPSTKSTVAPEFSRMYAISPAASRKFIGTPMAPSRFAASSASTYSGRLPMSIATRSPAATPRAASAAASRSTRTWSSFQVVVSPRKRSATSSGRPCACRSRWLTQCERRLACGWLAVVVPECFSACGMRPGLPSRLWTSSSPWAVWSTGEP